MAPYFTYCHENCPSAAAQSWHGSDRDLKSRVKQRHKVLVKINCVSFAETETLHTARAASENEKSNIKRRWPTHDNKNRYTLKMPPMNPDTGTGALFGFASASANRASKPHGGRAPNSLAQNHEKNKPKTIPFHFFKVLLK